MAKVRMYHAASNRYQYDAAENFEPFHQPEGWVLAPEGPDMAELEVVVDGTPEADPDPEPTAPKRGRAR